MRHAIAIACMLVAGDAAGWRMAEHRAVGTESYIAACDRLAPLKDRDTETAVRYEVACGNLSVLSFLYGQGTSVAGDFVSEPNDLLSASGAIAAMSRTNYYRLALTNSAHFHPLATREWRDFHEEALREALAAARQVGAEQIGAFEKTFAISAFGDHFLQDAFAAGHMGFSRPNSSSGASKAFHDEWNERGRRVVNRKGEAWITYGDGGLDRVDNRESRRRIVAACTESVYGVLAAFVLGERDPEPDYAVWREVPFAIDDQELLPTFESLFHGSETLSRPMMLPLLAVQRPARKDRVLGIWSSYTMSFEDDHHPIGSLVFGGDVILPFIGTRIEGGLGIAFEDSFREPRLAANGGLVRGLGLSLDGLLSHEIDAGALVAIGDGADVVARISYRLNVEAGDWILRPEVGPAFDIGETEFGFYVSLGIAKVLRAAGGGGRF